MQQIKVFSAMDYANKPGLETNIESSVNNWLNQNGDRINVVDISMNTATDQSQLKITVMIVYVPTDSVPY